jgi:exo-beta-1,3-glucanase (GH17 family)
VFVSCSNELQDELAALGEVIADLNGSIAAYMSVVLDLINWPSMAPDVGRLQAIINEQVGEYDIFVGIMWRCFGEPTGVANSGVEEEFNLAYERRRSGEHSPRIIFYFCERPIPYPKTNHEIAQLKKAFEFKQKLLKLGLCATYSDVEKFKWLVHRHISLLLVEGFPLPHRPKHETVHDHSPRNPEFLSKLETLNGKLDRLTFVGYAPVEFDPDRGMFPSRESLEMDCAALATSPFKGIYTFGSDGSLKHIPEIAKSCGLQGVIMGVFDPTNNEEIQAAIDSRRFVDGYCVGHNGLGSRYAPDALRAAIQRVRDETKLPVTTTEGYLEYMSLGWLSEMVDWLFPDVVYFWHDGGNAKEAVKHAVKIISRFEEIGFGDRSVRIALKMVSYPSAGGLGLSEESQASFFAELISRLRFDRSISKRFVCMYFSAFDNAWKTPERGWSPAEVSTGLYSVERQPKQAVDVFARPWKGNRISS